MTGKTWLVGVGSMLGWDMSSTTGGDGRLSVFFDRGEQHVVVCFDTRDRLVSAHAGEHLFTPRRKVDQVDRYLRFGCNLCRSGSGLHLDDNLRVV
jgi:hypothetical protein